VQIRTGWALGDKGRGSLWLQNGNGVRTKLKTRRQGLQLSLGADGVLIGFKYADGDPQGKFKVNLRYF
jgi:hypothetical protein